MIKRAESPCGSLLFLRRYTPRSGKNREKYLFFVKNAQKNPLNFGRVEVGKSAIYA